MQTWMNQSYYFLWYSHYHYDVGRDTGITVSEHNSRVSGYNIGVVKGKEIAQEVCFIKLTTNFSNEPLRAIFDLLLLFAALM
mgnify:CR=1 FL=1